MVDNNREAKKSANKVVLARGEFYAGPIPNPEALARYEEILPGAADRIIKMAEEQSAHRQKIENEVIKSSIENSKRGQIFGATIAMVAIVLGFILILLDKPGWGLGVIISELVFLAGVFVYNRVSEYQERNRKK